MEYEQDFIRLLVISQSIDELVEALKEYQKDDIEIIRFYNGKDARYITITTILDEIQHMINDKCDFRDVAFELLETYCTLLNY